MLPLIMRGRSLMEPAIRCNYSSSFFCSFIGCVTQQCTSMSQLISYQKGVYKLEDKNQELHKSLILRNLPNNHQHSLIYVREIHRNDQRLS